MKYLDKTLTSSTGRSYIFLTIFILGSALHELLFNSIQPAPQSSVATVLALGTLVAFILAGTIFANLGHLRSRVTSGATLLVLGTIAIAMGRTNLPDPYAIVIVLCVAALGAQSTLHRKLASTKQTSAYSLLAVVISLLLAAAFVYGMYKLA